MRRSVLWLVLPAVLIAAFARPAPVGAFPLSTCTLSLASTDASGSGIDAASSGAADATQDDPFNVVWEGSVAYDGSTSVVIKNYTYQVEVFGVPTPIRGGNANDDGNIDGEGSVSIAANAPFRVVGLYYVSGAYTGEGGSCAGSGWFRLLGDPAGTVPWFLGLGLVALGVLGLYGGVRGHTLTSVLGGFALGLGLDLLLISYAVLPLGSSTPVAVLALMTAIGIIVGFLGRRAAQRRAEALA